MIKIFYGPKNEFKKILPPKKKYTSIIELAVLSDQAHKAVSVIVPGQEKTKKTYKKHVACLVANSEDYSGISETGIQSILSFLSEFSIKEMYFQNPPQYITDQLSKAGRDYQILEHKYANILNDHLKTIYHDFDENIIGQNAVKKQLVGSLYSLAAGRQTKPVVLMFYGPSGVGKTETAKYLSKVINEQLLRKQFSMYQSNEFADYVFGAKHNQGSLARDLLDRESNIILFDEFDKPNPIFYSAFYQMFDEGIFEDKNYRVNLQHSIIVCTSNFKSEHEIKTVLGEPIYARFDDIIKFEDLSTSDKIIIIIREFREQVGLLTSEEKNIVDEAGVEAWLISKATDLTNVRHIKRVVKQAISSNLIRARFES